MTRDYDPETHPAVSAAHIAYLEAYEAAVDRAAEAGMPFASAGIGGASVPLPDTPEGNGVRDAEYRLYLADKRHYDLWHAANKQAHPELYRDGSDRRGSGLRIREPDDWRDIYPHINTSTPYDLYLTNDREATWDDPDLNVLDEGDRDAALRAELEAGCTTAARGAGLQHPYGNPAAWQPAAAAASEATAEDIEPGI